MKWKFLSSVSFMLVFLMLGKIQQSDSLDMSCSEDEFQCGTNTNMCKKLEELCRENGKNCLGFVVASECGPSSTIYNKNSSYSEKTTSGITSKDKTAFQRDTTTNERISPEITDAANFTNKTRNETFPENTDSDDTTNKDKMFQNKDFVNHTDFSYVTSKDEMFFKSGDSIDLIDTTKEDTTSQDKEYIESINLGSATLHSLGKYNLLSQNPGSTISADANSDVTSEDDTDSQNLKYTKLIYFTDNMAETLQNTDPANPTTTNETTDTKRKDETSFQTIDRTTSSDHTDSTKKDKISPQSTESIASSINSKNLTLGVASKNEELFQSTDSINPFEITTDNTNEDERTKATTNNETYICYQEISAFSQNDTSKDNSNPKIYIPVITLMIAAVCLGILFLLRKRKTSNSYECQV